jgi:mono/diheme cytochrome c family protein
MRRRPRRSCIAGAVLLALAGTGCVLDVEDGHVHAGYLGDDPIALGGTAYRARCASCHGLEARGDGPVGAALRTAPPDLTFLAERHEGTFPRAYVIDVVTGRTAVAAHGSREMPVWSDRLDATEASGATAAAAIQSRRMVEAIAAYLESIQRHLAARARG